MKKFTFCCIMIIAMLGCQEPSSTSPDHGQAFSLKEHMIGLSRSGYLGSGAESVQEAFIELEKTDPAKAATVKKDLEELYQAEGNEAKVKKLAKSIAGKL